MELIRGLHNLREHHRGCVATIGAFDGVHLGHQAVVRALIAKARAMDLPSTVIVFEPLPREFFAPKQAPARIQSFREKAASLEQLGVDRLLRVRFDRGFSRMTAEDFIQRIFVDGLGVQFLMVGDDLRFGNGREGDFRMLQDWGDRHGYTVERSETLEVEGERVSSTRIRGVLAEGDFALAERLLGRPYSITGKVIYGRQLGRQIGSPTANLELHRLRAPLSGVYVSEVSGVAAHLWPAVANVGTRPTVNDSIKANLEVHLLDFHGNLYGKTIEVQFRQAVRPEQKFDSLDALTAQISRDIATTRQFFEGPVSAGD